MPLVRAQTILRYFTALPEDVATNVSWWDVPLAGLDNPVGTEIVGRLSAAYTAIGSFISPIINPRQAEVKLYEMDDPEPRQPFAPGWSFSIPAATANSGMPNECAVVMSYHRAQTSGTPAARRRGRMYLGPLASSAHTPGGASVMPNVTVGMRNAVGTFATALDTPINGAITVVWVQYSPTTTLFGPVVGGWVDNELDTQRRRGARPTIRQTIVLP